MWWEMEEGVGGINSDGRRFAWGGEHTIQCKMVCCGVVHVKPL